MVEDITNKRIDELASDIQRLSSTSLAGYKYRTEEQTFSNQKLMRTAKIIKQLSELFLKLLPALSGHSIS
jgi:uncharacterized protein YccT (UPF0319 family)